MVFRFNRCVFIPNIEEGEGKKPFDFNRLDLVLRNLKEFENSGSLRVGIPYVSC